MFDLSYSASQMKINAINSLEVTCSVFHSVAISTKLLEINYSDLYIKLKMVQKLLYRRGLFQTFAYSYSGVRSIEHTQIEIESLSFSFASLLTLPCAVVVVLV